MFLWGPFFKPEARTRQTEAQRKKRHLIIITALILGAFSILAITKSFADIITENDVRVGIDSELTYYLNVKEDGVDTSGIESSDSQIADVRGGRVTVTDKLPEGLIFQGFVTTSDGTFGAVSRSDSSIQCSGKVVDDTNEGASDTGTWNNTHTEYYYHGLHYDDTTRTVSFTAEKIKAGCQLTIGIITKTPATVDDPDTAPVETRRDFYNTAFAAEKDITAISNTVHAWIGSSSTRVYKVMYRYTGAVPSGAPTTPTEQSYPANNEVAISMNPTLEGYTFSGWTTSDATVTDGSFTMPGQDVELVGIWAKNTEAAKYNVTYVINGDKPADFMPPAQKEYVSGTTVDLDSTEKDAIIDGYKFSGWSTQDTTLSETGFIMPEGDVTIIGSFERISYKVCYEFEGVILPPNSASILPPCETHYPGDTVTTANKPKTDGYRFIGWYKGASFTMPEENVTIQGEWAISNGTFAPKIAKVITNPQDKYHEGDVVNFEITVTNTAQFAIRDVQILEQMDGATFIANDAYTIKTERYALIHEIPAGGSAKLYVQYKVTDNETKHYTNTVVLSGAIADNGYFLDTDEDYKVAMEFDTEKKVTPDSIININPNTSDGIIKSFALILGISILLVSLHSFHQLTQKRRRRLSAISPKILVIASCPLLAAGVFMASMRVLAAPSSPIKSVELTSQHTDYANNEPGSWNVVKSAEWIERGKARITFDVDTVAKVADNTHLDLVMVIDNSGSMSGNKIAQVKHDATELIESVLSDNNNRIGLVSFNSDATKLSNLTSDSTALVSLVNDLSTPGDTNYYDGFKKVEEVLEGYQKQENRELIMLFLTDGFPNSQTPNEIPEYQALKATYPYMTINGIQYEMGDEVLGPIRAVTDNQFIANMDSLDNVLFEASMPTYTYDDLILTDYINDEYWDVDGVDSIEATIGETALTHNGNTPVVTWAMNNLLRSGQSAKLTIDITLKNPSAIAENTFLSTNDHENIQSSLLEAPDESITSELTPVLKSSYKVTYEPNLPSTCPTHEGTLPVEQNYLPLSVVRESSDTISCNGYIFNGWEIVEGDPKILNDDYFKIMDDDVVLRATWTKPSISKSMDGEIREEATAMLDTGQNINVVMKKLSGQSSVAFSSANTTIKAIKTAASMSEQQQTSASIISTADSPVPVYAWFDNANGTIYIYSEADHIKANPYMAKSFYSFRGLEDISALAYWDTSKVTDMSNMFYGASSLANIDGVSNWDTSSVTNMSDMFYNAFNLTNIDGASSWDTSSVTNMSDMFYGASSLANIDGASSWDTSKVTNMSRMFNGASNLTNIDGASSWDTSKVTNMNHMFFGASRLTNIGGASNWNTSSVTSMDNMFSGASRLTNIGGASNWNTSSVTSMDNMFSGAFNLTNIDGASNWDTSKVTNMSRMFDGASNLTNIDGASSWDTSSVTSMDNMFFGAFNLTNIDGASNWDTSKVTNMSYMFRYAYSLANIDGASNWDTSSVTNMSDMFYDASSLANIDGASSWDTSKVTNMSRMFNGASNLTNIDGASSWDTSKVTNMNYMFFGASRLTNIGGASNWNTSKVTNMNYMFSNDSRITSLQPIFNWTVQSSTTKSGMFNNIPTSVARPAWY